MRPYSQHARRTVTGRVVDQPAFGQAQDDGVGIVGGEERALVGRYRQSAAVAAFGADEDAVEIAPLALAAFHAQGHPLAELVEFADLARGAERAGAQPELGSPPAMDRKSVV